MIGLTILCGQSPDERSKGAYEIIKWYCPPLSKNAVIDCLTNVFKVLITASSFYNGVFAQGSDTNSSPRETAISYVKEREHLFPITSLGDIFPWD